MGIKKKIGRGAGRAALPLLAAGGSWLVTIRSNFPDHAVALFWAGVALVLIGIGVQVVLGLRADTASEVADRDVADLRIAMKDALQPLIKKISSLPDLTPKVRVERLEAIADNAALALARLLLSHLDRPRANVYRLSPNGDAMTYVAYGGRGEAPGQFHRGSEASNEALRRVRAGETLVVKDMAVDPPPGSNRAKYDYASFVCVPIMSSGSETYAYGMLTVDSPRADSFSDTDVHTVTVVAELLAIAFALAYPEKDRQAYAHPNDGRSA